MHDSFKDCSYIIFNGKVEENDYYIEFGKSYLKKIIFRYENDVYVYEFESNLENNKFKFISKHQLNHSADTLEVILTKNKITEVILILYNKVSCSIS